MHRVGVVSLFARVHVQPAFEQQVHRLEMAVVCGGVEQRPFVRLVARVDLVRMLIEQLPQCSSLAVPRRVEQLALYRQRIDVRLERTPAGKAVLLRQLELRVGEPCRGIGSRSSSRRRFACLRSQSRLGLSGSGSEPEDESGGDADMGHLLSFERDEALSSARGPHLGEEQKVVQETKGRVEPFTRTVGRPHGTSLNGSAAGRATASAAWYRTGT